MTGYELLQNYKKLMNEEEQRNNPFSNTVTGFQRLQAAKSNIDTLSQNWLSRVPVSVSTDTSVRDSLTTASARKEQFMLPRVRRVTAQPSVSASAPVTQPGTSRRPTQAIISDLSSEGARTEKFTRPAQPVPPQTMNGTYPVTQSNIGPDLLKAAGKLLKGEKSDSTIGTGIKSALAWKSNPNRYQTTEEWKVRLDAMTPAEQEKAKSIKDNAELGAYVRGLNLDKRVNVNQKVRKQEEAEVKAFAEKHPVGSTALSIATSPLRGLSYLGQIYDYAVNGTVDENAGYNVFSYANTALREPVEQKIREKWGPVGSFAYSVGVSMGDFLTTGAIGYGLGAVAGLGKAGGEALTLAIMGSGAAADTTIKAKERGLSDGQAMLLGTVAGAAEIATEKVSIEKLLDKTALAESVTGYITQNIVAEGTEEVASDAINLIADVLVAKDKSEWKQAIKEYQEQGMTSKEAFRQALLDQVQSMTLSFAAGGVSGGIMAGGSAALDTFTNRRTGTSWKQRREMEEAAADEIRAANPDATVTDPVTRQWMDTGISLKAAKRNAAITTRLIDGKAVTDRQIDMLNLSDPRNRAAFTEQTGIIFPDPLPRAQIYDIARSAGKMETVFEAVRQEEQEADTVPQGTVMLDNGEFVNYEQYAAWLRKNQRGDFHATEEEIKNSFRRRQWAQQSPPPPIEPVLIDPELKHFGPTAQETDTAQWEREAEEMRLVQDAVADDWKGFDDDYLAWVQGVQEGQKSPGIEQERVQKPMTDNTTKPENVQEAPLQQNLEDVLARLQKGDKIPNAEISDEVYRALIDHNIASSIDIDADYNFYLMQPEDHIDNRSMESVGKRNVLAFGYKHPALHNYYVNAAEFLAQELDAAIPGGQTFTGVNDNSGAQFGYRTKRQASERISQLLDETGMSYDDIGKAIDAIRKDKGQENYAAAKRVELVLDDMLSNGFRSLYDGYIPPNKAYLHDKAQIPGASEQQQTETAAGLPQTQESIQEAGTGNNTPQPGSASKPVTQQSTEVAGQTEQTVIAENGESIAAQEEQAETPVETTKPQSVEQVEESATVQTVENPVENVENTGTYTGPLMVIYPYGYGFESDDGGWYKGVSVSVPPLKPGEKPRYSARRNKRGMWEIFEKKTGEAVRTDDGAKGIIEFSDKDYAKKILGKFNSGGKPGTTVDEPFDESEGDLNAETADSQSVETEAERAMRKDFEADRNHRIGRVVFWLSRGVGDYTALVSVDKESGGRFITYDQTFQTREEAVNALIGIAQASGLLQDEEVEEVSEASSEKAPETSTAVYQTGQKFLTYGGGAAEIARIEEKNGEKIYLVREEESPGFLDIYNEEYLARVMNEQDLIRTNAERRQAEEKAKAERAAKEAAEKAEQDKLYGYADNFSGIKLERIRKVLLKKMKYRDRVMTRADYIYQETSNGAELVEKESGGKYGIITDYERGLGKGVYTPITKIEYEFAKWVSNQTSAQNDNAELQSDEETPPEQNRAEKPVANSPETAYNADNGDMTADAKEETENGEAEDVAEVPDGTGVQQSPVLGNVAGRLDDGVEAEGMRGNESAGRTADVLPDSGRADSGNDGTVRAGTGVRRSNGNREGNVSEQPGGRDAGLVTEQTAQEIAQKEERAVQENPRGENYVIPPEGLELPNGEITRMKSNADAIQLRNTIISENRPATPEEQTALARYVGWGGLSNAFKEGNSKYAAVNERLKSLLTDEEYAAARASTTNAHFTSVEVVNGIYDGMESLGFTGGHMLEPSAGIGNFLGAMPGNLRSGVKSWTAVELDKVTGDILRLLYPNADVRIDGFQNVKIPNNSIDVAISNVPFGNYGVTDRKYPKYVTASIHNYFFAKALDAVRPGGLVVFITSRYTMDAEDSRVRQYMMDRADLLGAIRLPDTAFKSNAGTEVVTDILVLKKREANTPYGGAAFENSNYFHRSREIYERTNEYFEEHPEMVLGTPLKTGSMYRGNSLTYAPLENGRSLRQQIAEAFRNIDGKMDYPARKSSQQIYTETRAQIRREATTGKNGSIVERDGKLYKNKDGELEQVDYNAKKAERMKGLVRIRDTARTLLLLQAGNIDGINNNRIASARDSLNRSYDEYVKKNGPLHNRSNKSLAREDADGFFMLSLENYDDKTGTASKAAIFEKDTVAPHIPVTHADSIEDAVAVSMNETGGIDTAKIAQLLGTTESDTREALLQQRRVFLDRDGNLVPATKYLSGNIRAKLREAESLAANDPAYQQNVDALREILPKDIQAKDITAKIGATWIPADVYRQFAEHLLGWDPDDGPGVSIQYNEFGGSDIGGAFYVEAADWRVTNRAENQLTWGTPKRSFLEILKETLNNHDITITHTVDGVSVVDQKATDAAREKQSKIRSEFQKWVWSDETRKADMARLYNDVFNSTVTQKYDGSKLVVPGANPELGLKDYQKDAVARVVFSGKPTLLAHRVGAGKTYEIAASIMMARHLGVSKKPVIVSPKSLVAQWGKEFLKFFPAANILVLDEKSFDSKHRKEFANRIAVGDYDAVIMSREQFEKVPMSNAYMARFYQEQISKLETAIREARRANGQRDKSIKDMEKTKKRYEERMKAHEGAKDEDNISFDEIGIDSIYVDEAHDYKNLMYNTNLGNNVSGLGNKDGSNRAFDMYSKTRYLIKKTGGRGVVFATATPVMNSVAEMYHMMRYLMEDELEAAGIRNFDAFANVFTEIRLEMEPDPSGTGYREHQFISSYKNLPALQQMFRAFTDVLQNIPGLKIPEMTGGKRTIVESEPSAFHKQYMQQMLERAVLIRNRAVKSTEDNMAVLSVDGRKVALDTRIIDPSQPRDPGGKVAKCAANIYNWYKKSENIKGTQLVFLDLSIAKKDGSFSVYQDLKNLLVGMGIPAEEVAFIQDADTNDKRLKLFEAVNDGKVRVLIGSTQKMGTGMNAQERIVAMHHLDAPHRPGDIEQREGRGLRRGNINDKVESFVYITKGTLDSRSWDGLQRKKRFIDQIMAGEYTGAEAEGDGSDVVSFGEIKAVASGDPRLLEEQTLVQQINRLESLESNHVQEVQTSKTLIPKTEQKITEDEDTARRLKSDIKARQDTSGDKFQMILEGRAVSKRKDAGERIIKLATQILNVKAAEPTIREIGSFAGFKLSITNSGSALLGGAASYSSEINFQSPAGTVQSLEAKLRGLDGTLTTVQNRIEQNKKKLPVLKKTADGAFEYADELTEKRLRLAELRQEMLGDSGSDNEPEVTAEDAPADKGPIPESAPPVAETPPQEPQGRYVPRQMGDTWDSWAVWDTEEDRAYTNRYGKDRFGSKNARKLAQELNDRIRLSGAYQFPELTGKSEKQIGYGDDMRYQAVTELDKNLRSYQMIHPTQTEEIAKYGAYINWLVSSHMGAKWWIDNQDEFVSSPSKTALDSSFSKFGEEFRQSDAFEKPQAENPNIHAMRRQTSVKAPEWQTRRTGDTSKKPMTTTELIETIMTRWGINVGIGHMAKAGAEGQYNDRTRGIRTRIANDLPATSHELGHHLDNLYQWTQGGKLSSDLKKELIDNLPETFNRDAYKADELPGEGVAEFVRQFLLNQSEAALKYPKFNDFFLRSLSQKDRADIEGLADNANAYYSMSADTATDIIRLRDERDPDSRTIRKKIADNAAWLEQKVLDHLAPVKSLYMEYDSEGYQRFYNANYAMSRAQHLLQSANLYDIDGNRIGNGLKTVLTGIDIADKKQYHDWGEYLIARHAPYWLNRGQRITANELKNTTEFWERRKEALEKQYPEFEAAAMRLYEWEKQVGYAYLVTPGFLSEAEYNHMWEVYPNYVPLNRYMGDSKDTGPNGNGIFFNKGTQVYRAKGSGRDVYHPFDNILVNNARYIVEGIRMDAARNLADLADEAGINAAYIERIPTPKVKRKLDISGVKTDIKNRVSDSELDESVKETVFQFVDDGNDFMTFFERQKPHGNIVTVMRDGEPVYYQINDSLLFEALTSSSNANIKGVLAGIRAAAKFIQSNITSRSLRFSLTRNPFRDLITALTYTPRGQRIGLLKNIPISWLNFAEGEKGDDYHREFIAMGGGNTGSASINRAQPKFAASVRTELSGNRNPAARVLHWLDFIGDVVESGPREATYRLCRKAGMDQHAAFRAAMEITTDFAKGGKVSKELSSVFLFFNAQAQGVKHGIDTLTARDVPKKDRARVAAGRMTAFLTVSAIAAAIQYALANRNDDDKEAYQRTSAYTKNNFFLIPTGGGKFLGIPLPQEITLPMAIFNRAIETVVGGNQHAFDGMGDYAANALAPSIIADILTRNLGGALGDIAVIGPLANIAANRDFLGRYIVSPSLANLNNADQYNARTSIPAYWLGKFGFSPVQVDYYLKQTAPCVWVPVQELFPVDQSQMDFSPRGIMDRAVGASSSLVKDSLYSVDIVNWTYDTASAAERDKNSNPTDTDKAVDAKIARNMATFYGNYYRLAKTEPETESARALRMMVLEELLEYRDAKDSGYRTSTQQAVYNVCRNAGTTEAMLPTARDTTVKDAHGKEYTLTPEQYYQYNGDYNNRYWAYVESGLSYMSTDAEKARLLQEAAREAATASKANILAQLGAAKETNETQGLDERTVTTYKAIRHSYDADNNGSITQSETEAALRNMSGITDSDRALLWQYQGNGPGGWDPLNNPWRRNLPQWYKDAHRQAKRDSRKAAR